MSNPNDAQQQQQVPEMSEAEKQNKIKEYSRQGRLSFRNFAEHQLRNEFKELAMEKCNLQIKAFAECGKEEGLMVIFRCQEFSKDVKECMAVHNSQAAWERYKQLHDADLQQRVMRSKES
mmetsp:Transcript_19323/g.53739  ORF Transcript_19323/g.53739 Transcript_19323/m.53739 type:complete len:120 (-) Transcript_19323:394-753(-)|eukprot:CAMPEP_0198109390 /NCGR_PEP_ID=MMETSP1442-20131203/1423_1 /TAXON_ID= /ORGANISM="Craspedostauros australis, Strain CCMP3328" /LENGTH=119 /DNA_ID=CAMNT_0043765025 /DNA_START=103 /DNA_END=462 /DNA_ORIENTATION=-